jgi:hypothetical protein
MVIGSPWRRAAIATAVVTALAGAHAACRPPTQITVEIFTDVRCSDLRGTSITVGSLDSLEARPPETTTLKCSDEGRIGSLVIVPRGDRDDEIAIRVVTAFAVDLSQCAGPTYGPGCIVARRSLRFVPNSSLQVPIKMNAVCRGIPCGAFDTCAGGGCVSAVIADPAVCESPVGCGEEALQPPPAPAPDGGMEAAPVSCGTELCAFAAPPEWQLVTLGPRTIPCPSGLTARDVVRDPAAAPGACGCAACSVAPQACANPTLQTVQKDAQGACVVDTAALSANNAACTAFGGSLLASTGVRPITLKPACSAAGMGVPEAAATPARLCTPDPACTGAACGALPAGMRTCIDHAGDVTCPASFTKTLVADSVAVACPPCGCTVDVACPGTLTFYGDTSCTTNPVVVDASGVCIMKPGPVSAYRWAPATPTLSNCVAAPGGAPTSVTPIAPRTVCCP